MADPSDPLRNATRVAKAEAAFRARLAKAQRDVHEFVKQEYSFELDEARVLAIGDDIRTMVDEQVIGERWLFENYVKESYAAGTARTFSNLAVQSAIYKDARRDVLSLYMSQPYQNRIGLVNARVFEEMKGFSGELGNKLAATFARAVGDGLGVRDVAAQIKQNFEVTEYRAERIARTEINTALNRARIDESESASALIGLEIKLMHVAAFMPTSRAWHIARHGTLHTPDEQRLWWSVDGNSVNCWCTTVEIIIGSDGKPLAPGLITQAQKLKEEMQA